ncbi:Permease of the drug/metabolite transporter (DMT) superfamily [hydrothermal vent metagenome]|uniref:Permease of the drug/metabolite transporter (DMT) superfamily n=1 Tax=hydrothermal vent metagenome TaxID=652676 RepID=A0A3B0U9I6_9ZZZZ
MRLGHILMALVVVAIWGFNFVVIKLSVDALSPFLAAGGRFALAAFPAILFIRPPKLANGKTPWALIVGFGLTFGFELYVFLNFSIALGMPAGLASVVLQVQAFFTILIAFLVLRERARKMQIIGGIVAFAGIGLIGYYRFDGAAFFPFALTIAAAIAWALANVITRYAGTINPVALTVWGSLFAAIPLLILSALVEGGGQMIDLFVKPDPWKWGLLLFLAYPATLFGLSVWNRLLGLYPASRVAVFTLLVPITGLFSGWAVLGETIAPFEIVGGGLVIVGLGVTLIKTKSRAARIYGRSNSSL